MGQVRPATAAWLLCDCHCAVSKKRGRKQGSKVDYEASRLQSTSEYANAPSSFVQQPAQFGTRNMEAVHAANSLADIATYSTEPTDATTSRESSIQKILQMQLGQDSDDITDSDGVSLVAEWRGDYGAMNKDRIERAERAKQRAPPAPQDLTRHYSEMLTASTIAYENMFGWSEQKAVAMQTYFGMLGDASMNCDVGTAVWAASKAAGGVAERTIYGWLAEYENNQGHFSASLWGSNTKTPSMMADVEHRKWAREWVIDNMGHRTAQRNKRCADFQRAAHDHFGYDFDPKKPVISEKCALNWLHSVVGAEFDLVKRGTFVDGHGKDYVVEQRRNFINWYFEVYNRGPNFVRVQQGTGEAKLVDKDEIKNLLVASNGCPASGLTKCDECVGPRGINLGGQPKPASESTQLLSFLSASNAQHIDRPDKIWLQMCHDECCVHTLDGEAYCWKIPGCCLISIYTDQNVTCHCLCTDRFCS